jgi:hypothetical protein
MPAIYWVPAYAGMTKNDIGLSGRRKKMQGDNHSG